jgi:lipopolysaccharide export LptBFGC system permease protein LptF
MTVDKSKEIVIPVWLLSLLVSVVMAGFTTWGIITANNAKVNIRLDHAERDLGQKVDQPSPAFVIDTGQDNEFIGTYRSYDLGIFTSQHDNNAQDMKVARATIRYTQEGVADTIAYLPNLAIVWNVKIRVTTNFNDSGTDLLDVGTSTSGSQFINDLDISTGSGQFSSSNLSNPLMIWGNNYITARYDGQNNNATAGEVRIWIHYTLR